jgi:hypothetical protein
MFSNVYDWYERMCPKKEIVYSVIYDILFAQSWKTTAESIEEKMREREKTERVQKLVR